VYNAFSFLVDASGTAPALANKTARRDDLAAGCLFSGG